MANQYKKVFIHTKGKNPSGKKPDVIPRWEMLKYGSKEQIEWNIIPEDVNFTLKFDKNGCPFGNSEFDNVNNISGPPVVNPGGKDEVYHYSVEVEGHDLIDPGIIIWD